MICQFIFSSSFDIFKNIINDIYFKDLLITLLDCFTMVIWILQTYITFTQYLNNLLLKPILNRGVLQLRGIVIYNKHP